MSGTVHPLPQNAMTPSSHILFFSTGPGGLPLIGQVFKVVDPRKEAHFMKWQKQFGPIFYLYTATENIVVLSDPDLIREAFSNVKTANRPSNAVADLFLC